MDKLLGLVGGNWLAAAASAVVAGFVLFGVLTVNGWRINSNKLEAAELALKAEIACDEGTHCSEERLKAREAALTEAERTLRAEQKLNKEREDAYQAKLAEVDQPYRDAADRLARIRVCKPAKVPGTPAAPAGAGEPVPASPSDDGDGTSVAGLGPILRDCEADAAQLTEFQRWYAELRRVRNAET